MHLAGFASLRSARLRGYASRWAPLEPREDLPDLEWSGAVNPNAQPNAG